MTIVKAEEEAEVAEVEEAIEDLLEMVVVVVLAMMMVTKMKKAKNAPRFMYRKISPMKKLILKVIFEIPSMCGLYS